MKKLLTSLTAAILAGVMCISFAACGSETDDPFEKARAFKGTEVTAKQWNAAFEALGRDDAEYTVDYVSNMIRIVEAIDPETNKELNGTSELLVIAKLIKKGGKEYRKITYGVKLSGDYKKIAMMNGATEEDFEEMLKRYEEAGEEEYAEKKGENEWILYKKVEGIGWQGSVSDHGILGENPFATSKSGTVFDTEWNGYIPDEEGFYGPNAEPLCVIKFDRDGRLYSVTSGMDMLKNGTYVRLLYQENVALFTYEAEDFTIPTAVVTE